MSSDAYGSEVIGRRVQIWWAGDAAWFDGEVKQYGVHGSGMKHLVIYDDGDQKWHELDDEKRHGQLKWLDDGKAAAQKRTTQPPAKSNKADGKRKRSRPQPNQISGGSSSATAVAKVPRRRPPSQGAMQALLVQPEAAASSASVVPGAACAADRVRNSAEDAAALLYEPALLTRAISPAQHKLIDSYVAYANTMDADTDTQSDEARSARDTSVIYGLGNFACALRRGGWLLPNKLLGPVYERATTPGHVDGHATASGHAMLRAGGGVRTSLGGSGGGSTEAAAGFLAAIARALDRASAEPGAAADADCSAAQASALLICASAEDSDCGGASSGDGDGDGDSAGEGDAASTTTTTAAHLRSIVASLTSPSMLVRRVAAMAIDRISRGHAGVRRASSVISEALHEELKRLAGQRKEKQSLLNDQKALLDALSGGQAEVVHLLHLLRRQRDELRWTQPAPAAAVSQQPAAATGGGFLVVAPPPPSLAEIVPQLQARPPSPKPTPTLAVASVLLLQSRIARAALSQLPAAPGDEGAAELARLAAAACRGLIPHFERHCGDAGGGGAVGLRLAAASFEEWAAAK